LHPVLANRRWFWQHLVAWVLAGVGLGALAHAAFGASWLAALVFGLPMGVLAGPMCLSAWYVMHAMPAATTGALRMGSTSALAALMTAALWATLGQAWWVLIGRIGLEVEQPAPSGLFPLLFGLCALAYLLAMTVYYVLYAYEAQAQSARRALESEVAQRDAELRALRAQLDPHFLFNSLNSIAGLIPADPVLAREMCQRLADFLRDSLRLGGTARISLSREVTLAEQYLRIEQVRFGERLMWKTELADDTVDVAVPPLLLQPLVENAVRHGVAAMLGAGVIQIESRRAGPRVVITISNPRDPDVVRPGTGFGIDIVRRRLAGTYGDTAALSVEREVAAFRALVVVPVETGHGGGEA
jgi:two-component system, LytTR family, sensor histidine kinase AlgZ